MVKSFMQPSPVHICVAPISAAQGTGMSAAGQLVAYTRAFSGLDVTAAVATDGNPGSPPREAPV